MQNYSSEGDTKMTETYVHGDIEVKKTGRTAEKPMPGGKKLVMVEITPANIDDGNWKKWVNPTAMFVIKPEK